MNVSGHYVPNNWNPPKFSEKGVPNQWLTAEPIWMVLRGCWITYIKRRCLSIVFIIVYIFSGGHKLMTLSLFDLHNYNFEPLPLHQLITHLENINHSADFKEPPSKRKLYRRHDELITHQLAWLRTFVNQQNSDIMNIGNHTRKRRRYCDNLADGFVVTPACPHKLHIVL